MARFFKIASKVLTVIFVLSVLFITGFVAMLLPATSKAFYEWQFDKEGYQGCTPLELVKQERVYVIDKDAIEYLTDLDKEGLIDLMFETLRYCFYLEEDINPEVDGKEIPVFRQDEISHMKDVKDLFGAVILVVLTSVVVVAVLLPLGLIKKKSYYENCRKIPLYTIIGIGVFLAIIGIFFAVAFDAVFEIFHRIFFKGNYAFYDGVMIGMIGNIFYDLVPIMISIWFVLFGGFSVGLYFYHKNLNKKFESQQGKA